MNPILSTEEAKELLELIKETAMRYLNFSGARAENGF